MKVYFVLGFCLLLVFCQQAQGQVPAELVPGQVIKFSEDASMLVIGNPSQNQTTLYTCTTSLTAPPSCNFASILASSGFNFGGSVAISTTSWPIVAVGAAPSDEAFIFDCSIPTTCTRTQLTAPVDTGEFGISVAISSPNLIVVGAQFVANYIGGEVILYSCVSNGPGFAPTCTEGNILFQSDPVGSVTLPLGSSNDFFSASISTAGNLIAVGAVFHGLAGSVYIFSCTNYITCDYVSTNATLNGYNSNSSPPPSSTSFGDMFGLSTSLWYDASTNTYRLAVLAPYNHAQGQSTGEVYLYDCTYATATGPNCALVNELSPPGSYLDGYTFNNLNVDGSLLAFSSGVPNGIINTVYLYFCPTLETCYQNSILTDPSGSNSTAFGTGVELNGNQLAVGGSAGSVVFDCAGQEQFYDENCNIPRVFWGNQTTPPDATTALALTVSAWNVSDTKNCLVYSNTGGAQTGYIILRSYSQDYPVCCTNRGVESSSTECINQFCSGGTTTMFFTSQTSAGAYCYTSCYTINIDAPYPSAVFQDGLVQYPVSVPTPGPILVSPLPLKNGYISLNGGYSAAYIFTEASTCVSYACLAKGITHGTGSSAYCELTACSTSTIIMASTDFFLYDDAEVSNCYARCYII